MSKEIRTEFAKVCSNCHALDCEDDEGRIDKDAYWKCKYKWLETELTKRMKSEISNEKLGRIWELSYELYNLLEEHRPAGGFEEKEEVVVKKKKRTEVDFSKHELKIIKNDDVLIHHLKKPGTITYNNIKFINCHGIMAVTGDFGNWIFCREFHPSSEGYVSDQYWCEKIEISSKQNPYVWDTRETKKQIQEHIDNAGDYGYDNEKTLEYLFECKFLADCSEEEYDQYAYGQRRIDYEEVPKAMMVDCALKVVFDAFDEICKLISESKLKNQGDPGGS